MSKIIVNELLSEKMKEVQDKIYIQKLQTLLDKEITFDDFLSLGRVVENGVLYPNGLQIGKIREDLWQSHGVSASTPERVARIIWDIRFKQEYNQ